MKKLSKIILWLLSIILIVIAGIAIWIWHTDTKKRNPFTIIPNDAIFIIETTEMTKGWNTLTSSKVWSYLMNNEYFSEINKSATALDSMIKGNKILDMLMSNRKLLISAHMINKKEYDFLFAIDLKKASKISFLKNYIKNITNTFGYFYEKRNFDKNEIIVLTNNKTKENLFITFIDNILVCSYAESIIQKSINSRNNNYWEENKLFKLAANQLGNKNLFNFYFNYKLLNDYVGCFVEKSDDAVNSLSNSLSWSALNFYLEDKKISLTGYTSINDSVKSYLHALLNVGPGNMRGYEILSKQTALYLSMSFSDFNDFRENLEEEFAFEDTLNYKNYKKNISRIEKLLKVNLKNDFFDWIGNEIVFSKTRPTSNSREEDVVIAIHARDTVAAKIGLNNITNQVKKRTPFKFEIFDYKNFIINQLAIKGFFKMFLGNLFNKLEKPYFTYIEDYVIFSNSISALEEVIDDYLKGETLSNDENFTSFLNEFEGQANITAFIMMPKLYSHLYYYSNKEKKKNISKNKEIILSFAKVGLQLQGDGRGFKTTIIAQHDPDALFDEELEKIEASAEDVFISEYETLTFKPDISQLEFNRDGTIKDKYADGTIKMVGRISNGNINGLWRTYYESGKIKSVVNYVDGKANGIAIFYYDNPNSSIKAEIKFNDDKIDGIYREFYENGARKATLTFTNGVANGDAEFYYNTGNIKIKGYFKDGKKDRKWKYYTETGELISKERWKRDNKK
ncbi:MAG TPA: DUF3352 domain-containing protein [Bacteroidales bacterium]|nr:DUF3352 domain-containing protein [Bacteroidales bacterium]